MQQYNKTIQRYLAEIPKEKVKVPDHRYRMLVIGGCGSGKANALLNLINH